MIIDEIVRLLLRLWLAGAVNIGLLLGQVGPFLIAAMAFGGWWAACRSGRQNSRDVPTESPATNSFALR